MRSITYPIRVRAFAESRKRPRFPADFLPMDHPLISLTIYVSLLSYLLALVCWVSRQRGRSYRILWTLGCVFMWAHAIAAFQFYHHWSHADAVELTAKETAEVLGTPMGNGIWFSYLLLIVWAIDVGLCWIHSLRDARARHWLTTLVQAYTFFILFNGTVIFEAGPVRWAGIIGTIWAARMAWRFRSGHVSVQ